MRFVELRPGPDREAFPLHRRITWLRGLDSAARVAIVGLTHDIALGQRPDWDGIVEIDGKTMTLAEGVAALGETGESALIVDAASLPRLVTDPNEPAAATEQRLAEATAELQRLADHISALAEELAVSGQVRSGMTAHLASAKAQVDADAGQRLDRADGELGRAARLASRPDPWTGMDDVPARIEELDEIKAALDVALGVLPTGDRPALAAAVATARAAIGSGLVPSPEAVALAEAWTSLHQRLSGLESRMEAAGGGTEAVAARLEKARAGARAAEDAAVPRVIRPDEGALLETLHDAMLDAEHRAGRGVRRGTSRSAFEKADAALQAALLPLGYPTWAAFRMGNGVVSVSEDAVKEYERAQQRLEAAELEWAQLMARLGADTELEGVLTAIDRALEDARGLLGADPYADSERDDWTVVTTALLSLRVEAESIGVSRHAAVAHLRAALNAAGASGFEDLTSEAGLVALGDSWLGVLGAADEAAVRILRDRERAEDESRALAELGGGSRVDRLHQERAAVRAAERDVAQCRGALGEVLNARMQLHVLATTELTLAEEHDRALLQREGTQLVAELAARRLDGTEGGAAADALADRVPRGVGGAIPVVVVMGEAQADILDRLVALPDDVQILVIVDGTGVDDWLDRVGSEVAAAVEVGSLV